MEPLSPTEPLQSTAINAASLLPETEQSSVQTEDLRYAERGCGESLLNTSCAGGELPPASPDVPSPSTSRAATSSLFPNSISTDTATAIDAHTTSHSSEHIRDDTSPRDQSASQPREQPLDQQGSAEGLNSGNDAQNAKMSEIKEGDQVSWNWGSGQPGGKATNVTEGEASMVSKKGNEVKKKGEPGNPAVHVEREGNDVVKKANELQVDEEGPKHSSGDHSDKKEEESKEDDKKETNGDSAKTGEKRSADEAEVGEDDKKASKGKTNGEAAPPPKKKGRPAKKDGGAAGGAKKDTKQKKAPKKAATASGEPRRSGRNKS